MQELERQFHIHCRPGDMGRYCILPGDPGRVPDIAAYFDDAKQVACNREYNVWTGYLLGEKVTACSGFFHRKKFKKWRNFLTLNFITFEAKKQGVFPQLWIKF